MFGHVQISSATDVRHIDSISLAYYILGRNNYASMSASLYVTAEDGRRIVLFQIVRYVLIYFNFLE